MHPVWYAIQDSNRVEPPIIETPAGSYSTTANRRVAVTRPEDTRQT